MHRPSTPPQKPQKSPMILWEAVMMHRANLPIPIPSQAVLAALIAMTTTRDLGDEEDAKPAKGR